MRTKRANDGHDESGCDSRSRRPEVLKIESLRIPAPKRSEVLIRVKAFGLNRSELFTRQGHSPSVKFPRVLGIEAVGIVEAAPGGEFRKGDIVATAMGGLGRQFDGGYAEYTCVPAKQVQVIKTELALSTADSGPNHLSCYSAGRLSSNVRSPKPLLFPLQKRGRSACSAAQNNKSISSKWFPFRSVRNAKLKKEILRMRTDIGYRQTSCLRSDPEHACPVQPAVHVTGCCIHNVPFVGSLSGSLVDFIDAEHLSV
jgi:Alcohol dehydrogenase GroES-like domain